MNGFKLFFLLALLFICPLSFAAAEKPAVYEDNDGNIYFQSDKHTIIIASKINIPLHIYPNNGLIKLSYINGKWQAISIAESEWLKIKNSLHLASDLYERLRWQDLDGDGIKDITLFTDSYGATPSSIVSINRKALKTSSLNIPTNSNIENNYTLSDINNDGYFDISSNDNVYLGNRNGTFIYAAAQQDESPSYVSLTAGQFNVDETGQATYQIPINLPKGPGGVKPNIVIGYSSAAGQGNAGYGWNVSATSAITRCNKNIATDFAQQAVRFEKSDGYCIDGQRLLLTSGEYGKSGSKYHTELADFRVIEAVGQDASNTGPKGFIVYSKDGDIKHYGDTNLSADSDAYITPAPYKRLGAHSWMLKQVSDIHGNKIKYHYINNILNGENLLNKITYGQVSISLDYTKSNSQHFGFQFGGIVASTKRIKGIEVTRGGEALRYYAVNSDGSKKDYIDTIQECTSSAADKSCKPSTKFSYHKNTSDVSFVNGDNVSSKLRTTTLFADFNGDGKSDVVYTDKLGKVLTVKITGGDSDIITSSLTNASAFKLTDFNGDGYTDILYAQDNKWYAKAYQPAKVSREELDCEDLYQYRSRELRYREPCTPIEYTETLSFSNRLDLGITYSPKKTPLADANGDGLSDWIFFQGFGVKFKANIEADNSIGRAFSSDNEVLYTFAKSDFPADIPVCTSNQKTLEGFSTQSADINGDGVSDFILKLINTPRHYTNNHPACGPKEYRYKLLLSKGSADYQQYDVEMDSVNDLRFIDLNADGLNDLVYIKANKWKYRLSTGDPTNPLLGELDVPNIPSSLAEADFRGNVHFTDLNNDNITDIVAFQNVSVQIRAGFCRKIRGDGQEPYFGANQTSQNAGQCRFDEVWVEPLTVAGAQLKYWLGNRTSATELSYTEVALEESGRIGIDHSIKVADINGDGLVDILTSSSKLDVNAVWNTYKNTLNNNNLAVNKLHTVENGFGVKTNISYKPLHDATVYKHLPAFNTLGKVNADFYSPKSGMWLVNKVETDSNVENGITEKVAVEYLYAGMKIHKQGRGPQGFYQVTSKDLQTDITTTTQYHQAWPLTGRPEWTKAYVGDELITEAESTWQVTETEQGNIHVFLESNTEQGWQIGSDGVRRFTGRKVTENQYDTGIASKWGNLTQTELKTYSTMSGSSSGLVHKTVNVNTYFNDEDSLRYGRLKSSTVEQIQYAVANEQQASTVKRKTEFTYLANLMLDTETVAGDCITSVNFATRAATNHCDVSNQYVKQYSYDAFGNTTRVSVTSGGETRTTKTEYDATGEFVISKSNALGDTEHYLYNGQQSPRGVIYSTTVTGPNGLATTTRFNRWGESYQTLYADGNEKNTFTSLCGSSTLCAGVKGYYYNSLSESGMPTTYSVYDKFGRNVRNTSVLVDGSTVYEDIVYDKQNNPIKKSLPYKVGDTVQYTEFQYDTFSRLKKSILAHGKTTSVSYKGRVTTTADHGGTYNGVYRSTFYRDEKLDWLGRTLYTTDPYKSQNSNTNRVVFSYNAFGDVVKTTNKVYNTARNSFEETATHTYYDRYGRKIKVSDPTKGTWKTYYNGFNEVIRELNARGEIKYNQYDVLGRLIRSQQRDKASNGALVHCNVYGTSKNERNIGKLTNTYQFRVATNNASQSCHSLITQNNASVSKTFSFDDLGRPEQQSIKNAGGTFKTVTAYNNFGQPSSVALPNGMMVNTHYRYGQAYSTYNSLTGMLLSRIDAVNAQGQVTKQTLAGNVTRDQSFDDSTGFITSISVKNTQQTLYSVSYKHDIRGTTSQRDSHYYEPGYTNDSIQFLEEFSYEDNGLQRLTGRAVTNTVTRYNTAVRLDNQTYTYDAYGNIKTNSNTGTYNYTNAANPYQLTGISGRNGKRNYTMSYDDHGNIYNDGQRRFDYTQFDKPYKITKSSTTYTEFKYDEQGSRYYRKDVRNINGAQQTKQTYYVGKAYELTRRSGGKDSQGSQLPDQIEHRWYVGGVVLSQIEGQAQKVQVAHTDMLGSTVLITDHQGKGIGQYIYDPWGKQQQVYTSQALTNSAMLLSQMRSFTGHEQMDELEVIHMNGRIYDANIGRFLQADPFLQFPNLTQSHNRYSYVLNNPLTYNDPSGYFLKKLLKVTGLSSILKAIASIPILDAAVSIVIGVYAPWALPLYQSLKTYAVTGSFGAALKSYVISYATVGVSQYIGASLDFSAGGLDAVANVAAHSAVGGVTSVLQGGKFGHGFVSSLVTTSMKGFMNPKTGTYADAVRRTAIAGVVGGTVSKLTGGKFANGAVTSAMQWWYNAEGAAEFAKRNHGSINAIKDELQNIGRLNRSAVTRDEARLRLATLEEILNGREYSGKELSVKMSRNRSRINFAVTEIQSGVNQGFLSTALETTSGLVVNKHTDFFGAIGKTVSGMIIGNTQAVIGVVSLSGTGNNSNQFKASFNEAMSSNTAQLISYELNRRVSN